jgi:hypothetical protein
VRGLLCRNRSFPGDAECHPNTARMKTSLRAWLNRSVQLWARSCRRRAKLRASFFPRKKQSQGQQSGEEPLLEGEEPFPVELNQPIAQQRERTAREWRAETGGAYEVAAGSSDNLLARAALTKALQGERCVTTPIGDVLSAQPFQLHRPVDAAQSIPYTDVSLATMSAALSCSPPCRFAKRRRAD